MKYYASDIAGNASAVQTQLVKIDTAPPTNSISLTSLSGGSSPPPDHWPTGRASTTGALPWAPSRSEMRSPTRFRARLRARPAHSREEQAAGRTPPRWWRRRQAGPMSRISSAGAPEPRADRARRSPAAILPTTSPRPRSTSSTTPPLRVAARSMRAGSRALVAATRRRPRSASRSPRAATPAPALRRPALAVARRSDSLLQRNEQRHLRKLRKLQPGRIQ